MKFSVLLPTCNRLEYLRLAVETVRRQEYQDWEIIISDNNSDQDVAGYVASLQETRIAYLRSDHLVSVTSNWNAALDASTGDYVIMLGDDDALMPGYFQIIHELIERHQHPDFVYTSGYLYAYPGVLPDYPHGMLDRFHNGDFFKSATQPFELPTPTARRLARQLLDFRRKLGLNMQYSVISRRQIDRLRAKGPVFQSPFPDYYATCAMFLTADRILVDPRPLVAIGITPKSYGFFLYNHREEEGVAFLNSLVLPADADRRRQRLLPGTNSNTSWLLAMEAVKANYGFEMGLRINYRRYRMLQILYGYSNYFRGRWSKQELRQLTSRMTLGERLLYGGAWGVVALLLGIAPPALQRGLGWAMNRATKVMRGSVEWAPSDHQTGYRNILDVFESVRWPAAA